MLGKSSVTVTHQTCDVQESFIIIHFFTVFLLPTFPRMHFVSLHKVVEKLL